MPDPSSPTRDGDAVSTPPSRPLGRLRGALFALAKIGAVLFAITVARASLADQYQVPTASMEPTIEPGDRIFVDKMAYDLRLPFSERVIVDRGGPSVGDLVILIDPRDEETTLVKRVVALAGQTVAVRRGSLIIDGKPMAIEHLDDGSIVERLGTVTHAADARDVSSFGPITVPPNHVFVMGDNRSISLDSRFIGSIPRDLIRGRVVGLVYHDGIDGFDSARVLRPLR